MKITAVQLDIVWENKPANHQKARALLERARPEQGSLVLLPEMFATGFSMNVAGVTDSHTQETHRFLGQTARELGIHLMGGLVTHTPDGRGLNEAVVFGPDGNELHRYAKMQPFTLGGESDHYAPGPCVTTFRWHDFTVSPFICYDLRFPELFRRAARRGATVLTVIANWPVARTEHWTTLLRARAIENLAYVIGVNRVGSDPELTYPGRSMIIDPKGNVLADAGERECTITADLDPCVVHDWRRDFPALADMRPDCFPADDGGGR
jgi:predicted amidohydrolase